MKNAKVEDFHSIALYCAATMSVHRDDHTEETQETPRPRMVLSGKKSSFPPLLQVNGITSTGFIITKYTDKAEENLEQYMYNCVVREEGWKKIFSCYSLFVFFFFDEQVLVLMKCQSPGNLCLQPLKSDHM